MSDLQGPGMSHAWLEEIGGHLDRIKREEAAMTTTEFIGPDGSILLHTHGEKCECAECDTAHWMKIEVRENAHQIVRSEVALSDDLTASFHREAMSLSLINEHSILYLDRNETYRLFSLLEAELKGGVA